MLGKIPFMNYSTPTFVADELKARNNIRRMAEKAKANGLLFRPHFKTHQSVEAGEWFRSEGVTAITVSSAEMAQRFAGAGWNDITIAFPHNLHESEAVAALAEKITINLLFDNPEQAAAAADALRSKAGFFIKADTGYHRAGILPGDDASINAILGAAKGSRLRFKGFLTHAGHTYRAGDPEQVLAIHRKSTQALALMKAGCLDAFPEIIASAGDTPSCSIASEFQGVDEIRPGNFVYYDLMQWMLGSCTFHQIAAAVICPVISVYPDRNEALILGGAVHLSKESLQIHGGETVYGLAVPFANGKWEDVQGDDYLTALSQEHGILQTNSPWAKNLKPGDHLALIPVHSCLAADLLVAKNKFAVVR